MNFAEYKVFTRGLLASDAGRNLIRLDCMNPAKALEAHRPPVPSTARACTRSELARCWRSALKIDDALEDTAISSGVRSLLDSLFRVLGARGFRLHLPADIYPAYLQMATAAGVEWSAFPTVPHPVLPSPAPSVQPEALLVADPLVPLGRHLSDDEGASLANWLATDERRLVLIDAVYTFGSELGPAAARLLLTGRAVLLHSFAKAFLSPNLVGFAAGPRSVIQFLGSPPPPDDAVRTAAYLLDTHPDLPARLERHFVDRWKRGAAIAGSPITPARTGYFAVCHLSFDELLSRGYLAVPGSVFGAANDSWCAVSCLLL
jgi:hypothetical protein